MDSSNWMYVALTSERDKGLVNKVEGFSYNIEEDVFTGLMIAKEYPEVVTDIEDYEEELTK